MAPTLGAGRDNPVGAPVPAGSPELALRTRVLRADAHPVRHLTEAQRRAYRIADNKLAESPWDDALLAAELKELLADDFDLSLTGIDDGELDQLLREVETGGAAGEAEDIPEPPEEPVSRPGDLWLLGLHRVLCGDATVITDGRSFQFASVALIAAALPGAT